MPVGRPTKYNKDMLAKAQDYLVNYSKYEHNTPSVVGLSRVLGVEDKTVQNWANSGKHDEFLRTLEQIKDEQHFQLINQGLVGKFNPAITKLMLHNFGHSDKKEIESTNTHKHEITDFAGMSDDEIRAIANQSEG